LVVMMKRAWQAGAGKCAGFGRQIDTMPDWEPHVP